MAKPTFPPPTIRAWQYTSNKGGIPGNLHLNPSAPLPKPHADQHLVQILATALNPIDYKIGEIPLVGRLIAPNPATPGIDFAGRIITPSATCNNSGLKRGDMVFGVCGTNPLSGGALGEYAATAKGGTGVSNGCVRLPEGVDVLQAAGVGIAGLTAYQSIVPHIKPGGSKKVFINGGSGGTGVWGIQIAKAMGCTVVTSCSTANVELCRSLGADEVVDYKQGSVVEALKRSPHQPFDHLVDNVGSDMNLYYQCHHYSKPSALYVMVGGEPNFGNLLSMVKRKVTPGFLGGGKREFSAFWPNQTERDLVQLGEWLKEGKVRGVIDQVFGFEEAPKALEKLKTGRAKGKIVVDVASKTYEQAWPKE